jgi:hypothetical protein
MNNALGIGSNIDTSKSGTAAIEDSHTDNASAIQQRASVNAVLDGHLTHTVIRHDAHQLDLFSGEEA